MWSLTLPRKGPTSILKRTTINKNQKEAMIVHAEQELMNDYKLFSDALKKFEEERDNFEEVQVMPNSDEIIDNILESLEVYMQMLDDRNLISERLLSEPVQSLENDEESLKKLSDENFDVQEEIKILEEAINTPNDTIQQAEKINVDTETRKNDLKMSLAQTSAKNIEYQNEIAAIEKEIEEMESTKEQNNEEDDTENEQKQIIEIKKESSAEGMDQYLFEKQVYEANLEEIKLREQILEDNKKENSEILEKLQKQVDELRNVAQNGNNNSSLLELDINNLSKKLADLDVELVQQKRQIENNNRLIEQNTQQQNDLSIRKSKLEELKAQIDMKKKTLQDKKDRVSNLNNELQSIQQNNKEKEIEIQKKEEPAKDPNEIDSSILNISIDLDSNDLDEFKFLF